jgi:hypothetical protein
LANFAREISGEFVVWWVRVLSDLNAAFESAESFNLAIRNKSPEREHHSNEDTNSEAKKNRNATRTPMFPSSNNQCEIVFITILWQLPKSF